MIYLVLFFPRYVNKEAQRGLSQARASGGGGFTNHSWEVFAAAAGPWVMWGQRQGFLRLMGQGGEGTMEARREL